MNRYVVGLWEENATSHTRHNRHAFLSGLEVYLGLRFCSFKHNYSNSVRIVFVPSANGSTLKGKNLLPLGANSFLLERTPFQKVLVSRIANSKSQNLFPL